MKSKKEKQHRIFSDNYFAIKWLYKISPGYTLYIIIFTLVNDISMLFEHTFMVAYIINCIEYNRPFSDLLIFFIPVTLSIILKLIIRPYITIYIEPKVTEKINKEIKFTLYNKAIKMDISKYDDPKYYDDFIWAMNDAPSHINGALDTFSSLLGVIITTVMVGFFMIFSDAVGLIFVFISVLVCYIFRIKSNKKQMQLQEDIMPFRRKRDYIARTFYLADYAKDLKTSKMSEILYKDFKNASLAMEDVVKNNGKRIMVFDYITTMFQKIITFDGLYLSYLLLQVFIFNHFSYGVLIALYNSSNKMKSSIDSFINIIPKFQQHSLYINKMRKFLESKNEIYDKGKHLVPETGNLILNNVHFSYPGNEMKILNGITMKIKKGEKIAIVGHNGAGKSTLVKLLLRFYEPSDGRIIYDNLDLSEYPLENYRKRFGIAFQDYEIFATTLGNNITMSLSSIDMQRITDIFQKTDFQIRFESLSDGINTIMTKEFDSNGINLSGGESQKVVLSRVLYSDASILIFDEPSSALDPIAEYRLNQTILEIARDKTVILITHRLSTTRFVDTIYMLENGEIIETGTHTQLMKQKGKYAEMYDLQASKYRQEKGEIHENS